MKLPYLPEGKEIFYVPENNEFMLAAKARALASSLDEFVKTGSVVVSHNIIIGIGANGSEYHKKFGCERAARGIPTGQAYELCEGCHPENHSEKKAIEDAKNAGNDTAHADLYLWGHWWCCKDCWDAIIEAGIQNVFLTEEAEKIFKR